MGGGRREEGGVGGSVHPGHRPGRGVRGEGREAWSLGRPVCSSVYTAVSHVIYEFLGLHFSVPAHTVYIVVCHTAGLVMGEVAAN